MDIDALHALTLNAGNAEASVTVNQRALIDKVLSRYSSENTLLRELLQNSDDANATSVKIIYESATQQPAGVASGDLNRRMTKRVMVKNNGQVFRTEDWARLSRIAEGNPDEAKIGAFGVGFYSVFSICEDPFVTSGSTALAFYWRQDQLFTRTANLPQTDPWTTFALNMRQDSEMPNLRNLTKFLATSLTFSRSVAHIELWLDDTSLCTIKRIASPDIPTSVPSTLSTITSDKMLKITSVSTTSVQISATYLNSTQVGPLPASAQSRFFSFFSAQKADAQQVDPMASTTSTMFLRVLTGHLTSSIRSAFAAELKRATKKAAPKHTQIQLVTVNAAELAASTHSAPIFENLLTFPEQGRVYIGFPTHQTTGFAGHVGAPCIIPTVERESIDLVDRYIKVWNFEVLRAIGLLARIAYHTEFLTIKTIEEAAHALKFFSMSDATPQKITHTIEGAFFDSSNMLPLLSTQGVQSSINIRLPDPNITFLMRTPILPIELQQQTSAFIERLIKLGYIESISIGDIKQDLRDRTLTPSEATMFLKYCAKISSSIDIAALSSLLRAGIVLDEANQGSPVNLGYITSYPASKSLPNDAPLPHSCLAPAISSTLNPSELQALHWQELSILEWLNFIVNTSPVGKPQSKDINTDPEFAYLVLAAVSKSFDTMSTDDRAKTIRMLQDRTCMPTKHHGMRQPNQTYFHTIKMFDDLPLILTMKGVKERFLSALGVRRTIELTIIFERLTAGGNFTTFDVVAYLASVRKDIPSKDFERLKATPFATTENAAERRPIGQLYEPNDVLRTLRLPIISWPVGRWKPQSEECILLYSLGLRKFPPQNELLKLAADPADPVLRERALAYFITNYIVYAYGETYNPRKTVAFVPTESGKLEVPDMVYSDPAVAIFGFEVLRKDLYAKATLLGIPTYPPMELLLQLLIRKPPSTVAIAFTQFSLIAKLQPVISRTDRDSMSQLSFIPIEKKGSVMRLTSPNKCFFKQTGVEPIYHDIFDFIDFGPQGNQFLRAVGVRDEPSTVQIAGMLVNDAVNVWTICGSESKYTALLTQISRDIASVKKDRHLWESMKRCSFLLAYKYVNTTTSVPNVSEGSDYLEDDNEQSIIQTSLQKAHDILIVDDVIDFNMFRNNVLTCPQDQHLEDLYRALGSSALSSAVLDRPITSGRFLMNDQTTALRTEILERLTVFFSEATSKPKRDIRDLAKSLRVGMQEKVAMQRELRFGRVNVSKHSKISALTIHEGTSLTLIVSREPTKYDIAVALCKVVLTSATTGQYLLLETLLTHSLRTLKLRGYNVDRILQKQEREKRERQSVVEAEERQAVIDAAEAKKASLVDAARREKDVVHDLNAAIRDQQDNTRGLQSIPGAFPEVPRQTGFLTNIKKGLGLNKPVSEVRPPVAADNFGSKDVRNEPIKATSKTIQANPVPESSVTSQASINEALQQAIRKTRSSDDKNFFSQGQSDHVVEAKSFCDAKPAQDLILTATLSNGMKFFSNRGLDQDLVVRQQTQAATRFSQLLAELGAVFNVNSGSLNVCYDERGPTIAFNKTGTIYCNLRFYNQLHDHLRPGANGEAFMYWFVTIAHELAHNLVSEHSSEHEFYMESMIVQYMPRLLPSLHRGPANGQSDRPPGYMS